MTTITVIKDLALPTQSIAFQFPIVKATPLKNDKYGRKIMAITAILPPSTQTLNGSISVNGKATFNKAGTQIIFTSLNFVNLGMGLNPSKPVDLTCSSSGHFTGKPAL